MVLHAVDLKAAKMVVMKENLRVDAKVERLDVQ